MSNKIRNYGVYFGAGHLWYLFLFLSLKVDFSATLNISKTLYTFLVYSIAIVISVWAVVNMYKEYKSKDLHPLIIGTLLIGGGLSGTILALIILSYQ